MTGRVINRWLIIGFLTLFSLYLLYPYLDVIIWSGLFSIILYPVYLQIDRKLSAKKSRKGLSALLTVSIFTLIILMPSIAFFTYLANSLANFLSDPGSIKSIIDYIHAAINAIPYIGPKLLFHIKEISSTEKLTEELNVGTLKNIFPVVQTTGASFFSFLLHTFVTIILTYQMILHAEKIKKFILYRVIGSLSQKEALLDKVAQSIQVIFLSMLLSGLIAGAVMTTVYFSLDFHMWLSLGILTGLLALIPFLLPIFYILLATVLFLNSLMLPALLVLIIGFLVNFITDNIIQPKLLANKAQFNFAISLLGLLAGLATFGLVGLFLGPVFLNVVLQLIRFSGQVPDPR